MVKLKIPGAHSVVSLRNPAMINFAQKMHMQRLFVLAAALLLMLSLGGCVCGPWFCGPNGPDSLGGPGGAGSPVGR